MEKKNKYSEYEFLTPVEMWADYKDVADHDILPLKEYKDQNINYKKFYFTAWKGTDKRTEQIRAYALTAEPVRKKAKTAILFIGGKNDRVSESCLKKYARDGHIAMMADYLGGDGDHTTIYPDSLKYCNYDWAGRHLDTAYPSAKHTSWYWWTCVMRSAISILKRSAEKITVIGVDEGTVMLYQLLAFDNNICGGVAMFGCGWTAYRGILKYGKVRLDLTEERECFISGISAESYMPFIEKPLLYVGNTNTRDIDRLGDSLLRLPAKTERYAVISLGYRSVAERAGRTIDHFINKCFGAGKKNLPVPPSVNYHISEREIYVELYDDASTSAEMYYSVGELNPKFRAWKKAELTMVSNGHYLAKISVCHPASMLFVFGRAFYENGIMLTTPQLAFVPSESDAAAKQIKPTRVIYDSHMKLSGIMPLSSELKLGEDMLEIAKGPAGINGLHVLGEGFSICKDADVTVTDAPVSEIQFNVYSKESGNFTVSVFVEDGDEIKKYSALIDVKGGNRWQRIVVGENILKDEDRVSIEDFSKIKRIDFNKCTGLMFNNILWV